MTTLTKSDWDILSKRGISPDNLSVGGYLDLRGTQITSLPDNLSVGGYLDLRGTQIAALYQDERGYKLYSCGGSYFAGCRRFSASEALKHWGSDAYPNRERGNAFCAAVKAEEQRREVTK